MVDNTVPGAISAAMLLALTISADATRLDNADFSELQQKTGLAAAQAKAAASSAGNGPRQLSQWYNFNNWPNWANVCLNGTWRNC